MERGVSKDMHVIEEILDSSMKGRLGSSDNIEEKSACVLDFWGREIAGHEQFSLRREDSCLAYRQILFSEYSLIFKLISIFSISYKVTSYK